MNRFKEVVFATALSAGAVVSGANVIEAQGIEAAASVEAVNPEVFKALGHLPMDICGIPDYENNRCAPGGCSSYPGADPTGLGCPVGPAETVAPVVTEATIPAPEPAPEPEQTQAPTPATPPAATTGPSQSTGQSVTPPAEASPPAPTFGTLMETNFSNPDMTPEQVALRQEMGDALGWYNHPENDPNGQQGSENLVYMFIGLPDNPNTAISITFEQEVDPELGRPLTNLDAILTDPEWGFVEGSADAANTAQLNYVNERLLAYWQESQN